MSDLAWMREPLAKLCGAHAEDLSPVVWVEELGCRYIAWLPDEDIAQAMKCLEAMRKTFGHWWFLTPCTAGVAPAPTLAAGPQIGFEPDALYAMPRAICRAIARALEWEHVDQK